MNQERLLKVLIAPHVSEKSSVVAEQNNQYVFKVDDDRLFRHLLFSFVAGLKPKSSR